MNCPKCGYKRVPEESSICPNCGEHIHGARWPVPKFILNIIPRTRPANT